MGTRGSVVCMAPLLCYIPQPGNLEGGLVAPLFMMLRMGRVVFVAVVFFCF